MNKLINNNTDQINGLKSIYAQINQLNAKIADLDQAIFKNNKIIADNLTPINNALTLRNFYQQSLAHGDLGIIDQEAVDNIHSQMLREEELDNLNNFERERMIKKSKEALLGLNVIKLDYEAQLLKLMDDLKKCKIVTLELMLKIKALDYEQKALDTIKSFKDLLAMEHLMCNFKGKGGTQSGVLPWQNTRISLPAINNGHEKRLPSVLNRFNDSFLIGIETHLIQQDESILKLSESINQLFSDPDNSEVK